MRFSVFPEKLTEMSDLVRLIFYLTCGSLKVNETASHRKVQVLPLLEENGGGDDDEGGEHNVVHWSHDACVEQV